MHKDGKIILVFTIPLIILIIVAGMTGVFFPGFYARETTNWQVQSIGQDKIDLVLLTPVLLLAAILSYRDNKFFSFIWAGAVLYTIYTFLIYCFAVHFNKLFVVYCLVLGLAFYLFTWFIYRQIKLSPIQQGKPGPAGKATGIYFLVISGLFYFLWLAEVLPPIINDEIPKSLEQTGLVTNPVHVIDLSVFLPGIFITGILLLRKKATSQLFAIIFLSFFILMDITIGWLNLCMAQKGLNASLPVTIIMLLLAIISSGLLIWNIKNTTCHERTY